MNEKLIFRFVLPAVVLLLFGFGMESAWAGVQIVSPSAPEIFHPYDVGAQDHSWTVTFTAQGSPPGGRYQWFHGFSAVQGATSATHTVTLTSPSKVLIGVRYTVGGEEYWDWCTMWYVWAKLSLDSVTRSEKFAPGFFIGLDDNDSDSDGHLDYLQSIAYGQTVYGPWPQDTRLIGYKVDVGGASWPYQNNFTLKYTQGGDTITRVFEESQGGFTRVDLTGDGLQRPPNISWRWLYLEGVNWGASEIQLSLPLPDGTTATDKVKLTVVGDIDADCDNDGDIDAEDEGKEQVAPGCVVMYNNDDDDGDGVVDCDDGYNGDGISGNADDSNPAEDDLAELKLSLGAGCGVGRMRLSALEGGNCVRLWSSPAKGEGNRVTLPAEWPVGQMPSSLWVEGVSAGQVRFILEHVQSPGPDTFAGDRLLMTVLGVDIQFPDLAEENELEPGLYINVNWDDDDGDGWKVGEQVSDVPPNAHYTGDKDDDEVAGGDDDLRQFVLSLSPGNLPGRVRLTYPDTKVRVWSSNTKKKPGGDSSLVPSGDEFELQELPVTLYLEGISGSDQFRDVELKAEYTMAPGTVFDVVKVTCFEVVLTGIFDGPQQQDNDKKHSAFLGSSDRNGRISWDDANGDGITGDYDWNCESFRNCMELQGTVKPPGVTIDGIRFDIVRDKWRRLWVKGEGQDWRLIENGNPPPWVNDDPTDADEDLSPSADNHIYSIDSPGHQVRHRGPGRDYMAYIGDFREAVFVIIGGESYQCSDFYKWHAQLYMCPKDATWLTRNPNKPQLLGEGWITVPDEPED